MNVLAKEVETHWNKIQPILTIHNDEEYNRAVSRLHELLDEIGMNTEHPLYELMDTLGTVIHAYEEQQMKIKDSSGAETLQYLMIEHDLSTSDLAEIVSQDILESIINKEKELNLTQIKKLAQRFSVSPAVFI